jgi:hypothetical protein
VAHIKSMQPDFEFQLRKIQPSLAAASADELFATEGNDGDTTPADGSSNPTGDGRNSPKIPASVASRQSAMGGVNTTSDAGSVVSLVSSKQVGSDHANSYTEGLALENFMKPLAILDQSRIVTPEDRRLLNRLKWVLSRLVDVEPEPEKQEEVEGTKEGDEEEEEDDFMDDNGNGMPLTISYRIISLFLVLFLWML